ncbi:hypothetical protein TheetDRAFT_2890 [Thermoanaerobacter ethanolicus JW 200]|nr:hypothetical protein TheetDRAFT_2890 [Thermoanaerobacter ethanolicus JW 200]
MITPVPLLNAAEYSILPLILIFRKNTVVPRNSKKWSKLYEKRPIIEKSISLLKSSIAVDSFKLINTRSIKADVFLGAITQHIGLIITAKLGTFEHPLSLKKLLA